MDDWYFHHIDSLLVAYFFQLFYTYVILTYCLLSLIFPNLDLLIATSLILYRLISWYNFPHILHQLIAWCKSLHLLHQLIVWCKFICVKQRFIAWYIIFSHCPPLSYADSVTLHIFIATLTYWSMHLHPKLFLFCALVMHSLLYIPCLSFSYPSTYIHDK